MTKKYLTYLERKGEVSVKEVDSNGDRRWVSHNFEPELFTLSREPADGKTIDGKHHLVRLKYADINSAREAVRSLGDASGDIYGYWKYGTAFICSKDYSVAESKDYNIVYHDIETEVGEGFPDVHTTDQPMNMITFIDRKNRIHAVTTCDVDVKAIEEEFSTGKYKDYTCQVHVEPDEEGLFIRTLALWAMYDPDIFVGFNSEKFDMPYIVNRMDKVLGAKTSSRLSPFGRTTIRPFVDDFGEDVITADITGVSHIDLMNSYKKFVLEARDSYSLDNLSQVDLGEGKLKHESGIPGHLLYRSHPTDGLRYNIVDVVRLKQIDEKKGIVDLTIGVAQMTKSNIEDVIFSTRLWMNMIYQDLRDKKIFFPIKGERKPYRKIEGGFVMKPFSGMHKWVGSFDYASLYPSIIMGLNVGVDTAVQKIPDVTPTTLLKGQAKAPEGLAMAANGQCYKRDKQSFMAELTADLYKKRKIYKFLKIDFQKMEQMHNDEEIVNAIKGHLLAENIPEIRKTAMENVLKLSYEEKVPEIKRLAAMYDNYDKSTKTLLNSLYGAMAEKNFYFYNPDVAESITLTGQYLVQNLGKTFDELLSKNFGKANYMVYGDTDSTYICFDRAVQQRCKGKSLQETIDWMCNFCDGQMKKVVRIANDHACEVTNAYDPSRFDADREAIAERGVFIKKKMYALSVWDNEKVRYEKPILKITGLSAKKASTPVFFREKMNEFFNVFLGGDVDGAVRLMNNAEDEFRHRGVNAIAENINVKDLTLQEGQNYFDSSVHINRRSILTHNHMISIDPDARREIEPLKNGDKVKKLKLMKPNAARSDVIAWNDEWPEYFTRIGLLDAIDWKQAYKDNFENKLKIIFEACGIDFKVKEPLDLF